MTQHEDDREAQVGNTGPADMPSAPWIASTQGGSISPEAPSIKRSPSGWWYLLCVGILIAGVIVVVIGVVNAAVNIGDNFATYQGPGASDVKIEQTGKQSIYLETLASSVPGGVKIEIADSDGEDVAVGASSGSATYEIESRTGRRIAMVDIPKAGTYTINSARYDESPEPYKLQIGNIGVGAFLAAIFIPAVASLVLSVAAFVTIFLLRRRVPAGT